MIISSPILFLDGVRPGTLQSQEQQRLHALHLLDNWTEHFSFDVDDTARQSCKARQAMSNNAVAGQT